MIFAIMMGALMLNYFIALTQLPRLLADVVGSLPIPPTGIVIVIMLFYIIGGCVMDVLGLMMLTLPIFIPMVNAIGYDLILFGVLTTLTSEMVLISDPFKPCWVIQTYQPHRFTLTFQGITWLKCIKKTIRETDPHQNLTVV